MTAWHVSLYVTVVVKEKKVSLIFFNVTVNFPALALLIASEDRNVWAAI